MPLWKAGACFFALLAAYFPLPILALAAAGPVLAATGSTLASDGTVLAAAGCVLTTAWCVLCTGHRLFYSDWRGMALCLLLPAV